MAVRRLGGPLAERPAAQARRFGVDPDWRRQPDGHAARLGPRETIDVARPVGRWHGVDPRRPNAGWRSVWKWVGLAGWAGTVGTAWWLGSSRGRGPLAGVRELDHLGESVAAAIDGFAPGDVPAATGGRYAPPDPGGVAKW